MEKEFNLYKRFEIFLGKKEVLAFVKAHTIGCINELNEKTQVQKIRTKIFNERKTSREKGRKKLREMEALKLTVTRVNTNYRLRDVIDSRKKSHSELKRKRRYERERTFKKLKTEKDTCRERELTTL